MKNTLDIIKKNNENFFKIENSNELRPFFMSIVSDSNHWLFISSNGGLTAGRKNSEFALFPYYTDDKVTEYADITGSKTIFRIKKDNDFVIWEPFSERYTGRFNIERNLYKNTYGNKVIFEEINHDLNLSFEYQWNSSNKFGFVRQAKLSNLSNQTQAIEILDGIQNVLPYGVETETQNKASNLVDAYKRNELEPKSGLGIFALSAIIVDKAEPSEALKANIAWSLGLENPTHLVSSLQLNDYRKGKSIQQETDVKAEKGAYFISKEVTIDANADLEWMIVADVNKNHSQIASLIQEINQNSNLKKEILEDIQKGTDNLIQLNASSDGLQSGSDELQDARHFSNTLFNIMRGGIFDDNYQIEKWDFKNYLQKANQEVYQKKISKIEKLKNTFSLFELKEVCKESEDIDFQRLCLEYLPLKFSRRHGDPSRPWNRFSINTVSEVDGSKILDYEGNWRDIFQNWEALALSYPAFIENMIHKFLNASTFDGYNPYRVTKDGFDWETIEPDDPWSYIGYWGDHQIIYLLKFLEFIEKVNPGRLEDLFDQDIFVYANVPYKIKSYQEILKNPKDTIDFDDELDQKIRNLREKMGADGALLRDENNNIVHVNFIEKILATVLAKMSNFIAEGGIWMNTQRPEWNDANNALVGNGVSMVTLYYMRRFFKFFDDLLENTSIEKVKVTNELVDFYKQVREALQTHEDWLDGSINNAQRKTLLDQIGKAASEYRTHVYEQGFWGKKRSISIDGLKRFTRLGLKFSEHTIRANRRKDGLYHAYNLVTVENEKEVSVSYLSEMLEGQVAVLSSGYLSAEQSLDVLNAMKSSLLFREDQYSYILYPNKELPGFLDRNNIDSELVNDSALLKELVDKSYVQIIEKDINGVYHFNGNFKNAKDLSAALQELDATELENYSEEEKEKVLKVFENEFNHKAFTGRSGTFYGYEGLGSIYWHMVSKLLLSVQETCLNAINNGESQETIGKLLDHYYEIQAGIGVHKSPELYGAFPTDPYSHTPAGKGAQQPGMTGQVKEDILSRFGELGVIIENATLHFKPTLLLQNEFNDSNITFNYIDIYGQANQVNTKSNALIFTYCQIPVVYEISESKGLKVVLNNGETQEFQDSKLNKELSQEVFYRTGKVKEIHVQITKEQLK